ncbi:hypothetical protein V6N13_105450 [Hibiscus sabdariffa]|uniref:Uncharacterized protein n=1 Tax=Hibiscus sabdariffa TaxID=183260 RepID=A0ABR2EWW7_9ROSI
MVGRGRALISEADVLKAMFTGTVSTYELFIEVGCNIVINWIIIQFGDLGVGGLAKIDKHITDIYKVILVDSDT